MARYEPFMKRQSKESTILRPRKLKDLSLTKLKREIQREGEEHCPKEDAIAALDLYKKAMTKWEKAVQYKVQRTNQIILQQQDELKMKQEMLTQQSIMHNIMLESHLNLQHNARLHALPLQC